MSVAAAGGDYGPGAVALRLGEDESHYGWVAFASAMLMLLGSANIIEGIAAIGNSHFFVTRAEYVFGDLGGYGWVLLANGVAQAAAGVGVFAKNQSARWLGVVLAAVNVLAQFLFMQAYPFWSLALLAVDLLVIYGLVVHGGRTFRPV